MKPIQKGLKQRTIDDWEKYRQQKIDWVDVNFENVFDYLHSLNSTRTKNEYFGFLISQSLNLGWELNELIVFFMEQFYINDFRNMHKLGN